MPQPARWAHAEVEGGGAGWRRRIRAGNCDARVRDHGVPGARRSDVHAGHGSTSAQHEVGDHRSGRPCAQALVPSYHCVDAEVASRIGSSSEAGRAIAIGSEALLQKKARARARSRSVRMRSACRRVRSSRRPAGNRGSSRTRSRHLAGRWIDGESPQGVVDHAHHARGGVVRVAIERASRTCAMPAPSPWYLASGRGVG